jgi:hypothetical protein
VREHGGFVDGYVSNIVTLPAQGVSLVVLANGSDDGLDTCERQALFAAANGRLPAPSEVPQLPARPDLFRDYIGAYDELMPDSRAVFGRHSLRVNATNGDLEIEIPFFDNNQVPYSRKLFPVWRDGFVFVVQGFGFIINGIRPNDTLQGKVQQMKTRLFVGHRVSDQPGVYPPFPFKGTSEIAAQIAEFRASLEQTYSAQRATVSKMPDAMKGAFDKAVAEGIARQR